MSAEYVFEVEDWAGRIVRLTRRTFENHVRKRSITAEYLEEAKQTIQDPDIVQQSSTSATFLYGYGLGRTPYSRLYLLVVVYYRERDGNEEGVVATYFFTDDLARGEPIVEHRAQWLGGQRFPLAERD